MKRVQETKYEVLGERPGKKGVLIKAWTKGVAFEDEARAQLLKVAGLPFIYRHVAAMPDVHAGKGTTIGSVIPTQGAVIPAAVGVDIGCGMMAQKLSLKAKDLPDSVACVRSAIEEAVPVGFGSWDKTPRKIAKGWTKISKEFSEIAEKYPFLVDTKKEKQLGTLGGGNHFIEVCLDESQFVWVMLHSGSRGVGNRIGQHFISLAKKDMEKWMIHLPDNDLAYFPEGTEHFNDYLKAVSWAQDYARINRELMMENVIEAISKSPGIPPFEVGQTAINCHHNYVEKEKHFGESVWITRKGAVRARQGDLGIIPGSMGARSYIVRGLGNEESFQSCSHGAGRVMSRTRAKKEISLQDHQRDTAGVECRQDRAVLDESPRAYKNIEKVMEAQADLVEILHTLKQIVCVKG